MPRARHHLPALLLLSSGAALAAGQATRGPARGDGRVLVAPLEGRSREA